MLGSAVVSRILKEKAAQYPELAFVGLGFGSVS